MAITQPSYPVQTDDLVTHIGTYVDAGTTAFTGLLTTHIDDTSAAHAASAIAFTPAGTIAATTAQTAIAEVATDAASALSTHEADTTSVHGIADTSALVVTSDARLAVAAAGTASIRAIGSTGTTACAGNDSRLSDTRTPADASTTLAKLHADLKALLSTSIVFNVTWPSRPTGWHHVEWHGGDASTDNPEADMEVNDLWFPDSE